VRGTVKADQDSAPSTADPHYSDAAADSGAVPFENVSPAPTFSAAVASLDESCVELSDPASPLTLREGRTPQHHPTQITASALPSPAVKVLGGGALAVAALSGEVEAVAALGGSDSALKALGDGATAVTALGGGVKAVAALGGNDSAIISLGGHDSAVKVVVFCPSGHQLRKTKADALYECGICRCDINKGLCIFDCRECDYCLCNGCGNADSKDEVEAVAAASAATDPVACTPHSVCSIPRWI